MAPDEDVDAAGGTGDRLAKVDEPKVKSRAWLVGCVRGSVSGYRRGKVSLRRVNAHVMIALTHGVSQEELSPLLVQHGLRWDVARGAVVDAGSYAGPSQATEHHLFSCPVCGWSLRQVGSPRLARRRRGESRWPSQGTGRG
jgi:hypothetical protein